jgi:hypothetical protein
MRRHLDFTGIFSLFCCFATTPEIKKADVAEHPWMLNHVGLLVNWPALRGLPFI